MTVRKDGFIYHLCATLGWLLIIGGIFWIIFLLFVGGSPNSTAFIGGIGAIVAGILVAMLAERNIFKALVTALSHLFHPFTIP